MAIAATSRLVKRGAAWLVPSQSLPTKYAVVLNEDGGNCPCPDHAKTGRACKHQIALQLVIKRELNADGDVEVTGGFRITYSQQSWAAYNQGQTQERDLFMQLFRELCSGIVEPPQKIGRPRLPLGDMVFAAGLYRGNSARRFTGDMKDAHAKGMVAKVPHFNSVLRSFDNEELTPVLLEMIRLSACRSRRWNRTSPSTAPAFRQRSSSASGRGRSTGTSRSARNTTGSRSTR